MPPAALEDMVFPLPAVPAVYLTVTVAEDGLVPLNPDSAAMADDRLEAVVLLLVVACQSVSFSEDVAVYGDGNRHGVGTAGQDGWISDDDEAVAAVAARYGTEEKPAAPPEAGLPPLPPA